jgi:L-ascorbate metabolism protein UlaG (beta-lactamase superfamily)
MEITYYGHSSFLVEMGGYKILFDPYISQNPLASSIDINSIEADFILISHGHGDHVGDVEVIAKRTGAVIVSNYEIVTWYKNKGFENGHEMNLGGKWHFDFGTVHMVNAVHSSSLPDGSYGGSAAGFVVESADKIFYYAGDTALHMDMKIIGEKFRPDFAMMPIGDNFTMDIYDAITAASFVNTRKIIGMHYDTFPYIEIDPVEADIAVKRAEKELLLMKIGETIKI